MKSFYLLVIALTLSFSASTQTLLTNAVHFEAKDISGITHNLTTYLDDGKYVLLSFYTVNCGTCMTYSPHISQTYENFGCNNGDVIVLGVNWGATNAQLSQHHQYYNLLFPALSGLEGYGNDITSDYQIESFISVILIAPDGEIVNQYIFPPSTAVLDSTLLSYGLNMMDCTVGIGNPALKSNTLLVYPNPASSSFRISNCIVEEAVSVKMYDLQGRLVRDYGLHLSPFPEFSLGGVRPGVFVVQIKPTHGASISVRLTLIP